MTGQGGKGGKRVPQPHMGHKCRRLIGLVDQLKK